MRLELIVKLIRLILNKERRGQVKPSEINTAIQNAERDLFNELVDLYRYKGLLSDRLVPFKQATNVTFTNGIVDASSIGIEELVSAEIDVDGELFDADIAVNDKQWTSKNLTNILDQNGMEKKSISRYIETIITSAGSVPIPPNFIRFEGATVNVSGEDYPARLVSAKDWAARKMSDLVTDPEKPDEPVWLNIEEDELDSSGFADGSIRLPENVVKLIAFDNVVDGERYEGVVVAPGQLNSSGIKDLYEDDGIMKKHISEIESEVFLTAGIGSLPNTFVRDAGVFYYNDHEGVILDNKSFMNRANSTLIPPTEEHPIARISGGMIEVLPRSIQSIKLIHFNWPNEKQPVGTIEGGQFRMIPGPKESVFIKTIKNPSVLSPIIKIEDGNFVIKPNGINEVKISYVGYPTDRAPIVRATRHENTDGGPGVDIVMLKPSRSTEGVLYFIKKLVTSEYRWVVYNRDYVFDDVNSTDTMFGDNAVAEIASKALIYMGISKENVQAAQLEQLKDNAKNQAS